METELIERIVEEPPKIVTRFEREEIKTEKRDVISEGSDDSRKLRKQRSLPSRRRSESKESGQNKWFHDKHTFEEDDGSSHEGDSKYRHAAKFQQQTMQKRSSNRW